MLNYTLCFVLLQGLSGEGFSASGGDALASGYTSLANTVCIIGLAIAGIITLKEIVKGNNAMSSIIKFAIALLIYFIIFKVVL